MRSRGEIRPGVLGTFFAFALTSFSALAEADCGDGVLDPDTEECDVADEAVADVCSEDCRFECTTNLNDAVADHTCTHVTHGPFGTQFAQAYPGTINTEVSQTHVFYAITMARNDADEVVDSAINLFPNGSADFAIYLNESEPVTLLDSEGQNVPLRLDKPVSTCAAGLARVQVYTLDVNESYVIVFAAQGPAVRSLVLEQVTGSSRFYSRDADGDGFGAQQSSVYTWCKLDSGRFVENDLDCDDTRASVYPGAPELCDGLDNDCDGSPEASDEQCEPVEEPDETSAPVSSTHVDAAAPPAESDAGTSGMDTVASGETDQDATSTDRMQGESSTRDSVTNDESHDDTTDGTRPNDADGGRGDTDAPKEDASSSNDEGCGCTIAGQPSRGGAWGVLCALVFLSCGLRRRVRG